MVRPMVDNFNQYRFINCGTTMATGDKQEPISTKKLALKDHLPNETKNTILKLPANSPLSKDTTKVSGLKRQQPSSPSSPSRPQPLGTNGTKGHLVFVRRKLDTEPRKMNHNNSVVCLVKKSSSDCKNEPNLQSETAHKAEISLPPSTTTLEISYGGSTPSHSIAKPIDELPVPLSNCSRVPTAIPDAVPVQPGPHKPRDYWKERFGRLQMFLKSCDESSQEEYIQRLRSLSAAGRSRHAYELEKRAIQLTLEEGKELNIMTALNVFGKASPDQNGAVAAQIHSPPKAVQGEQ